LLTNDYTNTLQHIGKRMRIIRKRQK